MLTWLLLCLAAAVQGQYSYPVPAPYPPATEVAQPVHSGRLQAIHFRSGPYPPSQPVRQSPSNAGPYPPPQPVIVAPVRSGPYPPPQPVIVAPVRSGPYPPPQPVIVAPVSSGPYPPALPSIEGGEISPIEQDSPKLDQTVYGLPSLSSPGQLQSPTKSYPLQPQPFQGAPSYPSYPSHPRVSPSIPQPIPQPFLSGGEVSPGELEIPPNSQINLQDNRLQYSHGFSDDKGTSVREQGSLLSTNDGWEYVIAKKGSYSYTSPEGKHITVNYIADHNGYRVIP